MGRGERGHCSSCGHDAGGLAGAAALAAALTVSLTGAALGGAEPAGARQRFRATLALRLGLALGAIGTANLFGWTALRRWSADAAGWFAAAQGQSPVRLDFDTVAWGGNVYAFGVPCTYVDLGLAAAVFALRRGLPWLVNLGRAGLALAAVLALALVKDAAQFAAIDAGANWNVVRIGGNALAYAAVAFTLIAVLERDLAPPANSTPA